jgi:hypothetical protein
LVSLMSKPMTLFAMGPQGQTAPDGLATLRAGD